jgi:hypothetical protein
MAHVILVFKTRDDAHFVLACTGTETHIVAVEVVSVSRSRKTTRCLGVLRQGGVVHADDDTTATTQM